MGERVIFLVDMDAFFAACEQLWNPPLRGKPVIVCGNPKTRSVVAACSYEAKRKGIENGMSVRRALALCPEARLVAGHPERYLQTARAIFLRLEQYTPLVEVVSIDEAFLDVTDTWERFCGTGGSWRDPRALARRIQHEVELQHGLSCTVGIGPNKLLAKLCTGRAKPHGIGRIRPDEIPTVLQPLPVEALSGIGPRWGGALREMGIKTLGDLATVPVQTLTDRFGVVGELFHQMALGVDERPVLPADAPDIPKSMGHAYTLERDVTDPERIRAVLLKLSSQVGRRLRQRGLCARTVFATVRFWDFVTQSRQRTGLEPLWEGLSVYRVAWALVEEIRSPLRSRPVRLVGVGVSGLTSFAGEPDLWEDRIRRRRLLQALDRINDAYGEEAIAYAGAAMPLVEKTRGYFSRRWIYEQPAVAPQLKHL